ncbi:MAG: hypothetical protein Q4G70_00860 [Pseudomonadota bacterium]|nr:hypothetical protein [Pseudomonadota bacterium]
MDALFARIDQALNIRLPGFYKALAQEFRLDQQAMQANELTLLHGLGDVPSLNAAYEIQRHLPDCLMIGNDSGGCGILVRADDSGDSNIYCCGLGALGPDELAVLAPSLAHWRKIGWASGAHRWYESRDLTMRWNSAEWRESHDQATVQHFLRTQLATLADMRAAGTIDTKLYLHRKQTLEWLEQRAEPAR